MSKRRSIPVIGYGEWHHEIPKSLGGSNGKENLVRLTAREHFIAHRLLVKMLEGVDKRKMIFALKRTVSSKTHIPNSRVFAQIRELYANQLRGIARSAETKKKISEKLTGIARSAETKKKISEKLTGIPLTRETKAKMSLALSGKPKTDNFKRLMSERLKDPIRDRERREQISSSLKGHLMSEETRRKISETRKRKFLQGTFFLRVDQQGDRKDMHVQ